MAVVTVLQAVDVYNSRSSVNYSTEKEAVPVEALDQRHTSADESPRPSPDGAAGFLLGGTWYIRAIRSDVLGPAFEPWV